MDEDRALFHDENYINDKQSIDIHRANKKSHNEKEAHEHYNLHKDENSNDATENGKIRSIKNSLMSILIF